MRRFWILIAGLVAAIPAGAQQLRGAVHDSASGGLLAGTVVTVLDSAGAISTRGITDASGRFTVTLAPRAARLRLIRIGYRPRDVQLPPIAERGAVLQLAMDRLPPMLEAVRVSGSELCPGSADVGSAFQLWEQARAGLLATVVARELKPAKATTLGFERGMSPDNERIHRQRKTLKTGQTTRPFIASAVPSFFVRFGYMIEDNGGRVFNAPDADVLVDESFASSHCFHLQQADAEHADQIGVAFTPARGRDTIVDVKGTIWIDRRTPQLRSLDFLYTSLEPAAMRMRAGGHIEFRTMENGVSFIERWSMRLPNLENIPRAPNAPSVPFNLPRSERMDLRVAEISEAGGLVLDALWADGTHWQAALATITGTVTQRRTHAPVLSGVVLLDGTGDTATTGANGEFRITTLPGKYTINVADTTFAAYVEPRRADAPVDARSGTASVRLEVDPIDGVVEELCRGQKIRPNTALIVGHLDQRAMRVPPSASVRATWQADYSGDRMGGRMVSIEQGNQDVRPDGDGRFVVCGVARERPIRMQLVDGGNVLADTSVKVLTQELTVPVEWRLSRAAAEDEGAVLEGSVRSEVDRRPLSGAQVSIVDLQVATTTGADGEFRIAHLTPGQHVVQIRQLGSEPLTDTIDFLPRMRRTRTFLLRKATVLDTVRTSAAVSALSPALRAFEERSRTGQGKYLADTLLRKNDNRRLSEVLSTYFPGLRIQKSGSRDIAVSTRDNRSGKYAILGSLANSMGQCYTTVYLDGVMIYDKSTADATVPPPNLNEFSVNQLGAIEFYAGQSTLPSQFKSSECGTLLLWTREK